MMEPPCFGWVHYEGRGTGEPGCDLMLILALLHELLTRCDVAAYARKSGMVLHLPSPDKRAVQAA
jgi:hypothetical protein|tara:strand:- start:72 stop:266 length:195 start_codon:yes stop_codon:yes gene_type:complete